ncbi:zinc ABC transporter substrate-binding protein [Niveispirillum lacus]|uniref:High-affinity zinc uptake system protein ZnuA n=1 Tax=Niveispirillum lacus TaxID=1981099 RepID=A0A255Z4X5_9PROT|nr:zinc ABC transporter substrate-binding protein [Niveispirillum lacus]OYQ36499.1 zinc ABC transporter substrate-binding protein [Niveispirillum lacus]
MFRSLSLATFLAGFLVLPALAAAPPPDVVVSVKPLHSLASGVMLGVGEPYLLVRGAASPHAFSLRPSDAKALSEAELVVWAGPGVENFLRKPLSTLGRDAQVLTLVREPSVRVLPVRKGGAWEAHDHDHAHEGRPDAELDTDGHVWLDPLNAKAITDLIAARLSALDPTRTALYQANADRQKQAIDRLDAEMRDALAPVKDRPFIVFHDAYHYLEDHYGLNAAGAITVSPDQPPGAARLKALRARINQAGAVCIFAEPQFEPALVRTLAQGTKARTGILDPEGANIPDGPDLYGELMRFNLRSLVDCLSGG